MANTSANASPGRGAGGAADSSGLKAQGRSAIYSAIALAKTLLKPWESAKGLFRHDAVRKCLSDALPDAERSLAVNTFILAGIITFIISCASIIGSIMVANTFSDTVQSVVGTIQPKVGLEQAIAPALLSFIIYIPVGVMMAVSMEFIMFHILRALGGKASFAQQLYLAGIVALATSFVSVIYIFFPIPCMQIIGAAALILLTLYLSIFCGGLAYSTAHKLHPGIGFAAAIASAIIKTVVVYFIINAVATLLGLPPQNADNIFQGA
jgi:hypothetical protein